MKKILTIFFVTISVNLFAQQAMNNGLLTVNTSTVQIGTTTADSALTVTGGLHLTGGFLCGKEADMQLGLSGRLRLTDVPTNSTTKNGRIVTYHYLLAEEDVALIMAQNTSAVNTIYIGGGSAAYNAATTIRFYTATNYNTITGTLRLIINNDGNIGLNGITSPSFNLSLGGGAARTIGMERATGSDGNILTINSGGCKLSTADLNGGNLVLSTGVSTGTGVADIQLLTPTASTTGTTDRNPVIREVIMNRYLIDNGTFTLESGRSGVGIITFGDGEEYAWFSFTTAAVVTLVTNSANVTTTGGTDNKLNIYDGGVVVTIENTFAAAKNMTVKIIYNL